MFRSAWSVIIGILSLATAVYIRSSGHLQNVFSTQDYPSACIALSSRINELIPDHHVYDVHNEILPKGTIFSSGTFDYAEPARDLPELCRFGAYFNTSFQSSVKFEIWMPTKTWNGRFAFVGNGYAAGAVNYPHMGGAVSNYGFAAASTNTGHESDGRIGTWAANNTDTQIDFGYRAVHLSTVFSKNILEAFYGVSTGSYRSYWIGCSAGGKQGLKEIQTYPEDFDGALVGCPAWHWSHLMAWSIMGGILNPLGPGYMSVDDWTRLRSSVISQCDALDGLEDGIVANPAICHIDWEKTGLSPVQQEQAKAFYRRPKESWEELVFPEFTFGSEEGGLTGANGNVLPFSIDYFKYHVLQHESVEAAENFTISDPKVLAKYVALADKENPGGCTADNYNISPFFNRGGKLLHYVGTHDRLIPYGSSVKYYERVKQIVGSATDASYHLLPIPGMRHCKGGIRTAGDFHQDPGQSGVPPKSMDPSRNAITGLIHWVEHGIAPNITATGNGFSRPLCPYPKFPKYVEGDVNFGSSFICR